MPELVLFFPSSLTTGSTIRPWARSHFFGEGCLLLSAAREALTTGAGDAFREAM